MSHLLQIVALLSLISSGVVAQTVRLANPNSTEPGSQYEGRVEVYHNGQWGTICSYGWDWEDAHVICRMMGFETAVRPVTDGYLYGGGVGPIWLDNVECTGNESSIVECGNSGWGNSHSDCQGHARDAAVVCTDDFALRLVNGSVPNEGRVEVYHSDQWGTICGWYGWGIEESVVICRQLGYSTATDYDTNAHFGRGSGVIWMDYVQCNGSERSLAQCSFGGWGANFCGHYQDVSVTCQPSTFSAPFYPIRLVSGGNTSNSTGGQLNYGRVEIFINDTWGTICDQGWGIEDAEIACRQLGFWGALVASSRGTLGRAERDAPIYFEDIFCEGDELFLSQCHHHLFDDSGFPWLCGSHYYDAGVICQVDDSPPPPPEVRLVNDYDYDFEGRVEVKVFGIWGTICSDYWDFNDGDVVCRMLNFSRALRVDYFGSGDGPIWMDNVQCIGNETRIDQCDFPGWGIHNCGHYLDAGLVCSTLPMGENIRLVGGSSSMEGRVEIFHDNQWGTVCDDGWDEEDATVVCNQLGFVGTAVALPGWQFGAGSSSQPIWLDDVACVGREEFLSHCPSSGWGNHNCQHYEDAGVVCQGSDFTVPIRLYGGDQENEGTVEIFYQGRWGTVCDIFWSSADAAVVCAQLGYEGALRASRGSEFGDGGLGIVIGYSDCYGGEPQFGNCSGFAYPPYIPSWYCNNNTLAGVHCLGSNIGPAPIRLVGGSSSNEGRVEILVEGEWGTICDDGWDTIDAEVVCRQLGFPADGALALSFAHFGEGSGPIILDDVNCLGLELYLTDCPNSGYYQHNCAHSEDAGVHCPTRSPGTNFTNPVRLVINGSIESYNEGTVLIFHNGTWGTVCDDYWGFSDAQVVCHMLGFSNAVRAYSRAYFGEGRGPIMLDNVRCVGTERELIECSHTDIFTHNCVHSEDAGVSCTNYTSSEHPVRLQGGSGPYEGRVEVYYSGRWGTVCDDQWDLTDANVVCHQLGYDQATRATVRAEFGQGTGDIWMDNVHCTGLENSLDECEFNGWGDHNCGHYEDAGAVCEGELLPIRLVDGTTNLEGRVEIYYNDTWGTICDDFWDLRDARVACRQLGFVDALRAEGFAHFGAGEGPIWLDDVSCIGTEETLFECSSGGLGQHNCRHSEDAGVVCTNETIPPVSIEMRLSGGRNATEGRVEIKYNGTWGTICDDSWGIEDAEVVCRFLGFESALEALSNAYFGAGNESMPIWLDDVHCYGSESTITECLTSEFGVHNCRHYEDAGVRCFLSHPLVRLVGGNAPNEGRVEVFHQGEWGTVCDDHWNDIDAGVVCRELGYARAINGPGFATFGQGTGRIWLDDVECVGTELSIFQCPNSGWGQHNCGHNEDASAVCTDVPLNPHPLQLVGGTNSSEGRVEIFYNNEWGTICDDHWTLNEANVVCRSLGFPRAVEAVTRARFGSGSNHIWLDEVVCVGTEYFIQDCQHDEFGENNCNHQEDAGVICEPMSLQVRLVNGTNSSSGRLEVNYNHMGWGTVCDDYWSLHDADVACKMLGLKSAISAPHSAYFGEGNGTIWFDDFLCSGNENTLLQCSHAGLGIHNCQHSEDASVICSGLALCPSFSQEHGHFTISHQQFGRFTEGTMVDIRCNRGYSPIDDVAQVRCSGDGYWSPNIPKCAVACFKLTAPQNGSLSTSDHFPGVAVNVSCNPGFIITGDFILVCLDDGSWNHPMPSCTPVSCPGLVGSPHLIFRGSGNTLGSVTMFSCDDGYTLQGSSSITCLSSGAWSDREPTCVPSTTSSSSSSPTSSSVASTSTPPPVASTTTSSSLVPTHSPARTTTSAATTSSTTSASSSAGQITSTSMHTQSSSMSTGSSSGTSTTSTSMHSTTVSSTSKSSHTAEPKPSGRTGESKKKSGVSTAAVAGGVIGGIILVVGIAIAAVITIWFIVRIQKRSTGYGRVSIRVDEEEVNLFSDEVEPDEEEDTSMQNEEDDAPLKLSDP